MAKTLTDRKKILRGADAASIGIEMGLSVVVGYLFGAWLDGEVGSGPWFMLFFLLCGVASGFKGIHRIWKRTQRVMRDQDRALGTAAPTQISYVGARELWGGRYNR